MQKISPPKPEKFQIKNSNIFHISAQNIDSGYSLEPPRWCGSNEYPQSMFLSRNKKSNVYPCKPQFYYIKVGFKGVNIIWACFRDVWADMSECTFSHVAVHWYIKDLGKIRPKVVPLTDDFIAPT